MSQNPNMMQPVNPNSAFIPLKQLPPGSTISSAQRNSPNPYNGLPHSNPSPVIPSPTTRPLLNNIYPPNSSLTSSRNSSPAMNSSQSPVPPQNNAYLPPNNMQRTQGLPPQNSSPLTQNLQNMGAHPASNFPSNSSPVGAINNKQSVGVRPPVNLPQSSGMNSPRFGGLPPFNLPPNPSPIQFSNNPRMPSTLPPTSTTGFNSSQNAGGLPPSSLPTNPSPVGVSNMQQMGARPLSNLPPTSFANRGMNSQAMAGLPPQSNFHHSPSNMLQNPSAVGGFNSSTATGTRPPTIGVSNASSQPSIGSFPPNVSQIKTNCNPPSNPLQNLQTNTPQVGGINNAQGMTKPSPNFNAPPINYPGMVRPPSQPIISQPSSGVLPPGNLSSQSNIPNLYQNYQTNTSAPNQMPPTNSVGLKNVLNASGLPPTSNPGSFPNKNYPLPPSSQSLPPSNLNQSNNALNQPNNGLHQQSMASTPFPGRQINPNMPPLVSSQNPNSNLNARYPPMPQNAQYPPQTNYPPSNYPQTNDYQQNQQPYDQYNGQQALTQQMGRMNVTQNSFNRMWGHETVDLLQCRKVLPDEKLEAPVIKLNHQFANSNNCSPEIFRCTLTKIPETNSLLQKARLPLGVLIHPFKDLNHLPVIQCSAIVRCRACRTYINPFVYFVDLKRWKCNLCYRVNELPEEFQYDPVTKSYGDPTRRPEIQSATIEYIAPSEYMLRPPQPAAYLFLLDVSAAAAESGYLKLFCDILTEQIDNLPGDSRTQLAFICFDSAVHFYFLGEGASRPREMTVIDIEDIFLPSPEDLLVNLAERKSAILELLAALPAKHSSPSPAATQSALGAALQAAHKLMAPTGGRITVFQSSLPNVGPGALTPREDPNNRSSKDVAHLNPATDFYKRLALDCSGVQVAVDLFLLNSQYADLTTLSGISRFSGGTVYHIPLFKSSRPWQCTEFHRCLTRYLTRKIGFEAVMRVRCTRGLSIHTFHGSFFVRSTDLLSLPNVSPDAGFGMQLSIDESLADVQHVCFQAALLYTSSKGERRIRVHTLCLPVVNTLPDVIHSADQQCIVGLLAKMGVDRSMTSSLTDAREAFINAAVDALGAQSLSGGPAPGLVAPVALRLLPLYLLALLKHTAFRIGTSTRLDDRIAAMCNMKSLPLSNLMRCVYPDLYPVHNLRHYLQEGEGAGDGEGEQQETLRPSPPRLHLSAEKVNATGAYLLDQEHTMMLYVGHAVDPGWLCSALGVEQHSHISDCLPHLKTEDSDLLHAFIDQLNSDRPHAATVHVIADNGPNRTWFTERLLDDRVESAFSYYEFLQHVKSLMK